jgi:hypothetical protein
MSLQFHCFFGFDVRPASVNDTTFTRVQQTGQEQRYKYLVDTTIKQYRRSPEGDNEGEWNDALWSMVITVQR